MENISNNFISSVQRYKPNKQLRWLKIVNNKVLIELKQNETIPKIDTKSLISNFNYVDPSYFHKNNQTYHILPKGLYNWHSDKINLEKYLIENGIVNNNLKKSNYIVRNRPNSKKVYNQNKQYKNGYVLIVNNNLEKFNENEYKEKHPFNKDEAKKLVSKIFEIASCNILKEEFYKKYSNNQKMDQTKRYQIFKDSFKDEKQFKDKDIICFQECSNNIEELIDNNNYNIIIKNSLAILFNKKNIIKLWDKYINFSYQYAKDRGFLATKLKFKNNLKEILVINTHLKGGTLKNIENGYITLRKEQIKDIINYINNIIKEEENKNLSGFIICGDFNTDGINIISDEYNIIKDNFVNKQIKDAGAINSQNKIYPTYYDKANNKNQRIDYILFDSKKLKLNNYSIYPNLTDLANQLLHHESTDNTKSFFSDHAIIKALFEFI